MKVRMTELGSALILMASTTSDPDREGYIGSSSVWSCRRHQRGGAGVCGSVGIGGVGSALTMDFLWARSIVPGQELAAEVVGGVRKAVGGGDDWIRWSESCSTVRIAGWRG